MRTRTQSAGMSSVRRFRSAVCVLCVCSLGGSALSVERAKRELKFPKGGSFVAAVALATLLPKGPTDGFAHVLEFDLGFPFPEELAIGKLQEEKKVLPRNPHERITSQSKSKAIKKHLKRFRKKRNLKDSQRQSLLWQMEDVLMRVGFNGSSCVSRFRCELQDLPPNNHLLKELLFTLFKTSDHNHGHQRCHRFHHLCPISFLHLLMHSYPVPPTPLVPSTSTPGDALQPQSEHPPPPPQPRPLHLPPPRPSNLPPFLSE